MLLIYNLDFRKFKSWPGQPGRLFRISLSKEIVMWPVIWPGSESPWHYCREKRCICVTFELKLNQILQFNCYESNWSFELSDVVSAVISGQSFSGTFSVKPSHSNLSLEPFRWNSYRTLRSGQVCPSLLYHKLWVTQFFTAHNILLIDGD